MISEVKKEVFKLLKDDKTGHDIAHVTRVLNLSLIFAEKEHADKDLVSLIALLHEVDDYKLFGKEYEKNLYNAKIIMNKVCLSDDMQNEVLNAIDNIGFQKRLKGIAPLTLEGKIVSDADMCDSLGVNGVLRVYQYCLKHGKPFFDRNIFPNKKIHFENKDDCADSSVCHIFDKILKLKDLMLTSSGKEVAVKRHKIVEEILYSLFEEENAPEWSEYLNKYVKINK